MVSKLMNPENLFVQGAEPLGYLLVQIAKLQRQRAHALLDALGLHRGQQWVLHALWHEEGLSQAALAQRLNVRPATMTRCLQGMVRAQLVERQPDPDDRRVARIYLSPQGRALRHRLELLFRNTEADMLRGFAPAEAEHLRALLRRVRDNLAECEPWPDETAPPGIETLDKEL
ncbi:MAG: MarR family transcriptional regulator [Chloroflexota bacterium]